jgi:hypothetical protein
MVTSSPQQCAYCECPIEPGDRWVREKIYESAPNSNGPSYFRYHADLFVGEEISCWEKHQMELEITRTTARAA